MLETGDWDKLLVTDSFSTLTGTYSKATLKMIRPTVKVFTDTKVDKPTKETGLMICNMATVLKF